MEPVELINLTQGYPKVDCRHRGFRTDGREANALATTTQSGPLCCATQKTKKGVKHISTLHAGVQTDYSVFAGPAT